MADHRLFMWECSMQKFCTDDRFLTEATTISKWMETLFFTNIGYSVGNTRAPSDIVDSFERMVIRYLFIHVGQKHRPTVLSRLRNMALWFMTLNSDSWE